MTMMTSGTTPHSLLITHYFLNRDSLMETLIKDSRYAIRSLAQHPGFTAFVVLTLALGIGANTAIFTVVNAVLLRPLPYPNSDALMSVFEKDQTRGVVRGSYAYPNFFDLREQNHVF